MKFIQKLHYILESREYHSCIWWSEEGTSFIIQNTHTFVEKVISRVYNHSNYSSFVRQLNSYGFKRVYTSDPALLEYSHPLFVRGKYENFGLIQRRKCGKRRDSCWSSNSEHDASFDEMVRKFTAYENRVYNKQM